MKKTRWEVAQNSPGFLCNLYKKLKCGALGPASAPPNKKRREGDCSPSLDFLLALFFKNVADDEAGDSEYEGNDGNNDTDLEHDAVISDDEFHFSISFSLAF